VLACTLLTGMYESHARALAESFFEHNAGIELAALVVDGSDSSALAARGCRILTPADIGLDERETARRAVAYEPQGFVVSMKANLLRTLLADDGDAVLLIDADALVLGSVESLFDEARRHQIVLTGHWTTPHAWPDPTDAEVTVLRGGAINSGVMCVGVGAEPMLDWWAARLRRDCVLDQPKGVFLDQMWLSEVPTIFQSEVLREAGVNASLLSLHDADVEWRGEAPYLHGAPVRVWHFLGAFDPHDPDAMTGGPWLRQFVPYIELRSGAHRLARAYARRLRDNDYDAVAARPYAYSAIDGVAIDRSMRIVYREGLLEAERTGAPEPPNPLLDGVDRFFDWLASPTPEPDKGAPVPRYLMGHYRERYDVRWHFPGVPGPDSGRFMDWAHDALVAGELAIPQQLVDRTPFLAPLPEAMEVDSRMRRLYRDAVLNGAHDRPPATLDGRDPRFRRWLVQAVTDRGGQNGVMRYALAVRDERPELIAEFPRVPGADAARFAAWFEARLGTPETKVPDWLVAEIRDARGS
jgi:hypothetical protein